MPITITMPRLSDTMEEGTLLKWNVKEGDSVSSGDAIADVETDKATMEVQVFDDATVAKINIDEGATVPVGDVILILAEKGESAEDAIKNADAGGGEAASKKAAPAGGDATPSTGGGGAPDGPTPAAQPPASGGGSGGGKIRVSPLARKLADEHGVELSSISGSGPDGRIIKRDVLAAAQGKGGGGSGGGSSAPVAAATTSAPVAPMPSAGLESKTIQLTGMRKTIAKRLVESKTTVPHFQVSVAVNMDPLMELRKTINGQLESQGIKLSINDFVTRAVAMGCVSHPAVNSSWNGDSIVQHGTVHVGVAVSLPDEKGGGLLVATVRDTHQKGLRQISADVKDLAKKARSDKGLTVSEMSDSTITISNLGMPQYGVTQFTAIVNPPNAAIIAVGAAIQKPVVRDGAIVIGHEMNVTLSGDHRTIDGAVGAQYLATVKRLLENPAALLV